MFGKISNLKELLDNANDFAESFINKFSNKVHKTIAVDGKYNYEIEVPGLDKSEINIEHNGNTVTVKGKNNNRNVDINLNVNNDEILSSKLVNGILYITMKENPINKNKKINID